MLETVAVVATLHVPVPPTAADRKLMAELGIGFRQGAYEFGGSRYDQLGDAVHYARLIAPRLADR